MEEVVFSGFDFATVVDFVLLLIGCVVDD